MGSKLGLSFHTVVCTLHLYQVIYLKVVQQYALYNDYKVNFP